MRFLKIDLNRMRSYLLLSYLFRFILAAVFIYAGVQKVFSPADFSQAVQNYMILPAALTNIVAIFLPWLEIYCGIFLLAGIFLRASALLITVMNLIFIIALFSALIRGLDISCGCFGSITPVTWLKIVEDLVLLSMSLHLYLKGASHP
jgi:putative oxidoreductase